MLVYPREHSATNSVLRSNVIESLPKTPVTFG